MITVHRKIVRVEDPDKFVKLDQIEYHKDSGIYILYFCSEDQKYMGTSEGSGSGPGKEPGTMVEAFDLYFDNDPGGDLDSKDLRIACFEIQGLKEGIKYTAHTLALKWAWQVHLIPYSFEGEKVAFEHTDKGIHDD